MNKKLRALILICDILALTLISSFVLLNMPRVYATTWQSDNFENFPTYWTTGGSPFTPAKTAEQKHAGSYSAVANSTIQTQYSYFYNSTTITAMLYHYSVWIYVSSAVAPICIGVGGYFSGGGGYYVFRCSINYSGSTYYLLNQKASGDGIDETKWESVATYSGVNSWTHLELYVNRTLGKIHYYLNGVKQGSDWTLCNNASVSSLYEGDTHGVYYCGKIFYDDLAVDDQAEAAGDTVSPTISNIATNATEYGDVCNFTATISDNIAVWKYWFSTNLSGSWINDSIVTVANVSSINVNTTKTLNVVVGDYGFVWYAEDNSTNNATSGIQILMVGIIDYWPISHQDAGYSLEKLHPATDAPYESDAGETFNSSSTTHNVTLVKFYLKKYGSPTGTAYAVLYAMSGSYSSTSVPTGSPLATSDGFDVSTLTTSYQLISFTFSASYVMSASSHYCIDFQNPTSGTINDNNYVILGFDDLGTSYSGNGFDFYSNAWEYWDGSDAIFYVYGYNATSALTFTTYYGIMGITFTPSGSGTTWTFPLNGLLAPSFSVIGRTSTAAAFGGTIQISFQTSSSLTANLLLLGSIVFRISVVYASEEIPLDLVYALFALVVAPSVIAGYLVMRRRRKRALDRASETIREE